jgi:hypothetical protein
MLWPTRCRTASRWRQEASTWMEMVERLQGAEPLYSCSLLLALQKFFIVLAIMAILQEKIETNLLVFA